MHVCTTTGILLTGLEYVPGTPFSFFFRNWGLNDRVTNVCRWDETNRAELGSAEPTDDKEGESALRAGNLRLFIDQVGVVCIDTVEVGPPIRNTSTSYVRIWSDLRSLFAGPISGHFPISSFLSTESIETRLVYMFFVYEYFLNDGGYYERVWGAGSRNEDRCRHEQPIT